MKASPMGFPSAGVQRREGSPSIRRPAGDWQLLYQVGLWAAVVVLCFIPIQAVIYFVWPPPSSVIGWFALFQTNALVGLLDMDLLLMIDYVLMGLLFLALWAALWRANPSLMAIALILELVGVATYMASAVAFEMLSLSNQYAAATSAGEKAIAEAAGQAMLATWQGTAFNVSYVLGAVAVLLVSLVMFQGGPFGKSTAYVGLVMAVLMAVPPTVGTVGVWLSLLSLIPTVVWLILLARSFYRLAHDRSLAEAAG